jgi:hypothetical protein
MSKEQTKDKILELIRWIDSHESKLFRPYDFFSGWGRTLALLFVLLFIIAEFMNFVTASATERISISLASVAVFMAFISIVIQTGESNRVEGRFERVLDLRKKEVELSGKDSKLRDFNEDEKPLLKALIKIKSENEEFDLERIYNMNSSMFTKEKLLERLYERN